MSRVRPPLPACIGSGSPLGSRFAARCDPHVWDTLSDMSPALDSGDGLAPSDELRAITSRWFAAIARADADAALARFSAGPAMTYWGTDIGEFVDDPEQLDRYVRSAFSDGQIRVWGAKPHRIDAWVDGRIGWTVSQSTVEF